MREQVGITGIGSISPFGVGHSELWRNLIQGKSALREITRFDTSSSRSRMAGEVLDFKPEDFFKDPKLHRIPRVSQYTIAAALMAVDDAGLDLKKADAARVGIFFGTCNGPSHSTEKIHHALIEKGPAGVEPLLFQETVFNAPVSNLSILLGVKGPCIALPLGLASGSYAFDLACKWIQMRKIDWAIVGAADEHSRIVQEAFIHLKTLTPDDRREEKVRPFDKSRNGFTLSEGSCFFVLEGLERARQRGVPVYGEVIGIGTASDAYRVAGYDPTGLGVAIGIKKALRQANIAPAEIDYCVATASGSRSCDLTETNGLKEAFGDYAYQLPVSSIKGAIGESCGPGGLFNLTAALLAMRDGILPPTAGHAEGDSRCDLDYIPGSSRVKAVRTVMVNSIAWGGIYSSIVVRRCAE